MPIVHLLRGHVRLQLVGNQPVERDTIPLILLGLFNSSHESRAISENWAPQIFPAIRYLPIALSSDRALANSIMTAVPELGSAAPNTQASRWLPRITNRSKLHKK